MPTVRNTKSTYLAAFLVGALIALLLVAPARSAEPAPLDRIAVVRFTAEPDGRLRQQHAVLHDDGRVALRAGFVVPRPANTPDWVLGRNLIPVESWQAYYSLGYDALRRFELHDGGARVHLGDLAFLLVAPSFAEPLNDGRLINVSARSRVTPGVGTDYASAGFVIEGRPRTVLIRAVGPTLQRFGIGAWLRDPFLSIRPANGQTLHFNDNWTAAAEAAAIRAVAARVGAFALDEAATDAARLVELPPGAYTVIVESATAAFTAGDVLIEIYSVPETALDPSAGL